MAKIWNSVEYGCGVKLWCAVLPDYPVDWNYLSLCGAPTKVMIKQDCCAILVLQDLFYYENLIRFNARTYHKITICIVYVFANILNLNSRFKAETPVEIAWI